MTDEDGLYLPHTTITDWKHHLNSALASHSIPPHQHTPLPPPADLASPLSSLRTASLPPRYCPSEPASRERLPSSPLRPPSVPPAVRTSEHVDHSRSHHNSLRTDDLLAERILAPLSSSLGVQIRTSTAPLNRPYTFEYTARCPRSHRISPHGSSFVAYEQLSVASLL